MTRVAGAPASHPLTGTGFAGFAPPAAVTITGHLSVALCESPGVLSDEIAVIGGPSRTVRASASGLAVCSTTLRTRGIINCAGGTAPTVGFRTCQDSSLSDGDQCPAPEPGAVCLPAAAANTGPACTTFVTTGPAAGQSFGLSTFGWRAARPLTHLVAARRRVTTRSRGNLGLRVRRGQPRRFRW
jgi:hypothetical protein